LKRLTVLLVAAALMAACGGTASVNVAAKPSTPPGPVTKYRNALPGQTAVAPIDLIQSILSFAPGAASVVHKHTSPNLGTVLQGQVTIKMASGGSRSIAAKASLKSSGSRTPSGCTMTPIPCAAFADAS